MALGDLAPLIHAVLDEFEPTPGTPATSDMPLIQEILTVLPDRAQGRLLLDGLSRQPELEPFQLGWLHRVGDTWMAITHEQLAAWLVACSLDASACSTLADLQAYLDGSAFIIKRFLIVTGIEVEHVRDIGNGVSVEPLERIPLLGRQSKSPTRGTLGMPLLPMGWAAITKEFKQTPAWRRQEDRQAADRIDYDELEVARLCLTLVHLTETLRETVGWVGLQTFPAVARTLEGSLYNPSRVVKQVAFTDKHIDMWRAIHQAFVEIASAERDKLRISLDRLSTAIARDRLVDSAIDLGIALEVLLSSADDPDGEVAYRLSLRAARFLGGSLAERKQTKNQIKGLYTLRSKAAHTGALPKPKSGKPSNGEVVRGGCELAARLLTKVIADGGRDWEKAELSP